MKIIDMKLDEIFTAQMKRDSQNRNESLIKAKTIIKEIFNKIKEYKGESSSIDFDIKNDSIIDNDEREDIIMYIAEYLSKECGYNVILNGRNKKHIYLTISWNKLHNGLTIIR